MARIARQIRCRRRRRGDRFRRCLAAGGAGSSGRPLRAVRSGPHPRRFTRQFADLPSCLFPSTVHRSGRSGGAALATARTGRRATGIRQNRGGRSRRPGRVELLASALGEAGTRAFAAQPAALPRQWPGWRFDTMVLHHPDAGRLNADLAVAAHAAPGRAEGAEIWHHSAVTGIRLSPSGVRVADRLGIDQVRPGGGRRRRLDRTVLAGTSRWRAGFRSWSPPRNSRCTLSPPRRLWVGPVSSTTRARSTPGRASTGWPRRTASRSASTGPARGWTRRPGTSDRSPRVSPAAAAVCGAVAARGRPGNAGASTCLYTTTPDHHFVIDRPGRSRWPPASPATGSSSHRPSANWSPAWSTGRYRHPTCSGWVPASAAHAASGADTRQPASSSPNHTRQHRHVRAGSPHVHVSVHFRQPAVPGSPSTHSLLTHVNRRILGAGHTVGTLQVRDLPAQALLAADVPIPRSPPRQCGPDGGRDRRRDAGVSGGVLRAAEGLSRPAAAVRLSRQGGAADRHRRLPRACPGRRLRTATRAGQSRRRAHRAGLVRSLVPHQGVRRRGRGDRAGVAGSACPGHRRIPDHRAAAQRLGRSARTG